MEKRLIIIDRHESKKLEIYSRTIFFLIIGFLAFTLISYSSFYIAKNINIERDKNDVFLMEDREFKDTLELSSDNIIDENNNQESKSILTLKKIEDLQSSVLFIRFEDVILIYSGISIFLLIFLRKNKFD